MCMAKIIRTTVVFTPSALRLRNHYARLYGGKKLMSAAIHAFDQLDEEQQKLLIMEMARENAESVAQPIPVSQARADELAAESAAATRRRRRHPKADHAAGA